MFWFVECSVSLTGWSGDAKVLGKLPVPGRPTNLDYSRARAYCACSRYGWGLFGHFFSHLSLLFSFSLSLGDGPLSPKQPTNCLIESLLRLYQVLLLHAV